MERPSPRRPRFLDSVADAPEVAPLRLATTPADSRAPSGPRGQILGADAPPPAAPVRAVDEGAIRREALARVASAVETLRAQSAHLGEQARAEALEIGFAVARAILATEIRQNPEALFSLVRAAVRRAGDSRRVVVRVSPRDLDVLQAGIAGGSPAETTSAARIELLGDGALEPGDCVVEAEFGRVDGRLQSRLSELRRAVDAADGLREGVA